MSEPVLIQVGDIRPNPHKQGSPDVHFFNEMPAVGEPIFAPIDCILPEHVMTHRDKKQNPDAPPHLQVFSAVRDADSYGACVHYQGVWENGTPLYVRATTKQQQVRGVQELMDKYWELAYQEGKEGRTHDTQACDAQVVRSALEHAIRQMAGR